MSTDDTRETLYLVDAHSLIFQVFHAIPMMTSPKGLPVNAVFGFSKDMVFLRNDRKPTYLICVFDKDGSTYREAIAADYKANRSPMPDDLKLQIPLICEMLEAMRIPVIAISGIEADDVIATLAKHGEARGMDVFLCTSDKDFRQLITDRTRMFNLRKQSVMGRPELLADWGVTPEQVIDYQTLVGDSVDNIKGVPGIGPKTATQLLQQYGTVDNLYQHLDEIKGKKRENLESAREYLPRTKELVRLKTDVELPLEWDKWRTQSWDGGKLLEMFRDFGFRGLSDMVRDSMREANEPLAAPKQNRIVQGNLFGEDGIPQPPSAVPSLQWDAKYHLVNTPEGFRDFLAELKKQDRIAIDLETTSLTPLEADIVGIAICWKEGEAYYLATCGPKGEQLLDLKDALKELKPILESPKPEKVNQNIKYDMQVFWRYGIDLQGVVGDPMVADYLLHAGQRAHNLEVLAEKHLGHRVIPITDLIGKGKQQRRMDEIQCARVAEYAGEDADVALRLCARLESMLHEWKFKRPADGNGKGSFYLYDDLEIPLIRVLADMETQGIRLDVPLLNRQSKEMAERLEVLEAQIYKLAGREFNIGSVKQLREILYTVLAYKPKGFTAITREASTDQMALEELAKEGHEFPRVLLQHRKIAKLKSTYVDALPLLVNRKTGRVHASFNQTVAATGRLSSSDPNLQNIPIRSEDGEHIRQAFIAREGWDLITADYSQIELRLLAHFCDDANLRRAFAEDRDIHGSVAAQVFGVEESAVTGNQRRMAKTINFGIIYGISPFGLAARLEIDKDEAAKFIEAYFATYPKVLDYQENLLRNCYRDGYVSTILGRRRTIQGIRERTSYKNRNQPEREAINMQIQGSAADMIKVAMVRIWQRLRDERRMTRMLLQIHDELVFEAPPEEREEMIQLVRSEMTQALSEQLTVPIKVDVGVGPNWLDLKDVV